MRRILASLPFLFALLLILPTASHAARYKVICGRTATADCDQASQRVDAEGYCESGSDIDSLIPNCRALCGAMPFCDIEALPEESSGGGTAAPTEVKLVNPLGTENIPQLIGQILNIFLGVLGSAAFLMFVYGGFMWLISGGSADRIKKGKDTMVWAALGLILVFSSAALVRFVLQVVGAGK